MTYVGSRRLFNDSYVFLLSQTELHLKSTQVLAENFVIVFFLLQYVKFLIIINISEF